MRRIESRRTKPTTLLARTKDTIDRRMLDRFFDEIEDEERSAGFEPDDRAAIAWADWLYDERADYAGIELW